MKLSWLAAILLTCHCGSNRQFLGFRDQLTDPNGTYIYALYHGLAGLSGHEFHVFRFVRTPQPSTHGIPRSVLTIRTHGGITRGQKYASIKGMARVFAIAVVLLLPTALAQDTFKLAAESEIQKLIYNELWGHYELELVSVLKINDRTAEWGGFQNGYGLKTVTARFVAVRNAEWSENLNRAVACDQAESVYLLCQPAGHEFAGKVEVDMAFTNDGWKVLSRNYRNLREFVLANYLLLEEIPKEGYVLPPKPAAR